MPVESCTQALCDVALSFGEDDKQEGSMVRFAWLTFNTSVCSTVWISKHPDSWSGMQSRPFGVALLLAGWDSDGPTL